MAEECICPPYGSDNSCQVHGHDPWYELESERDQAIKEAKENEGVFKVWRRRCQEAEGERDRLLEAIDAHEVEGVGPPGSKRPVGQHVFSEQDLALYQLADSIREGKGDG